MGYRDDFYTTANVVGYTGTLGNFPTWYFVNGNDFGHITHKHDESQNVGRMEVYSHSGYSYGNTGPNGALEEKINGKVFHRSRNPFIAVDANNLSGAESSDLAGALKVVNGNEKYISGWSREDFDTVDEAKAALSECLKLIG